MELISLGILFNDREYAEAAARAIAENERYFVPAVLEKDRVHNFTGNIIITDDDSVTSENAVHTAGFLLPSDIMTAVREEYGRIYGVKPPPAGAHTFAAEKRGKIIAVISSGGGSGCTSAADGLACEFTVYYDKSVCRISLSAFPEESEGGTGELRRLIFALESAADMKADGLPKTYAAGVNINEYFEKDMYGIYRASYGDCLNPLTVSDSGELYNFFEAVCAGGGFDYIIADIPSEALRRAEKVIAAAGGIVWVEKHEASQPRKRRLENYLELILGNDADKRIIRLDNFVREQSEEENLNFEYEKDGKNEILAAEYDPDSLCKDGVKIDGTFGLAVKNIAHRLIFC